MTDEAFYLPVIAFEIAKLLNWWHKEPESWINAKYKDIGDETMGNRELKYDGTSRIEQRVKAMGPNTADISTRYPTHPPGHCVDRLTWLLLGKPSSSHMDKLFLPTRCGVISHITGLRHHPEHCPVLLSRSQRRRRKQSLRANTTILYTAYRWNQRRGICKNDTLPGTGMVMPGPRPAF